MPRYPTISALVPKLGLFAILLLIGALTATRANATSVKPGFVTRSGTHLQLNGRPWRFAGYNLYWLTSAPGGYDCGEAISNTQVQAYLDQMQSSSSVNVVRVWFYQSFVMNGDWTAFDRLLADAAARNIKVIPTLTDQWGNCETQIGGQSNYHRLAWYEGGYTNTGDGYPLSYRDYVATVVARYESNPTIAFWQLVNEAEAGTTSQGPCDESAAATALRAFADDMTGMIKSIDHNHLVDLGTLGSGQCGTANGDYQTVHAGAVDLCEYHDYHDDTHAMPGDRWNGLQVRLKQCAALNKPLFVGEIGILANEQPDGSASGPVTAVSLARRAQFFNAKLKAQFAAGVAGIALWAKGDASNSYDIGPGDPAEAVLKSYAFGTPAPAGPSSVSLTPLPAATPRT